MRTIDGDDVDEVKQLATGTVFVRQLISLVETAFVLFSVAFFDPPAENWSQTLRYSLHRFSYRYLQYRYARTGTYI